MRISIVTAVLNRAPTILDALKSVGEQTHQDIEHVIQDGGSVDNTIQIIKSFSGSNVRLQSVRDSGIYDALNRGILRSEGDVIGIMHSDDFFASRLVLEKVSRTLSDPTVDGVYGDLEYISSRDSNKVLRRWRSGIYDENMLRRGWMPPHPTLFMRRAVFEKWGYYDDSFRISGDYEAMLRWLLVGKIKLAYIPEVMVKMRLGGESNKSLNRLLLKTKEDYRAVRRHKLGGIRTIAMKNIRKVNQIRL